MAENVYGEQICAPQNCTQDGKIPVVRVLCNLCWGGN